jgi:tRNA threonylcarbamoyl adenosine modification protein (Sua5/YciO/YrdC/YwlC family)
MLRLHVKLDHPQPRHVGTASEILRTGGLCVYPTDATYGLGCDIFAKRSVERIYQLKGIDNKHRLSFLCNDLSQVAHYAVVDDKTYRVLRHHVPGPYTFILPATREVPRLLQTNARTVGIRVPASPLCTALVTELGHPLITTTVSRRMNDETVYSNDPDEIAQWFARSVDVLLDGGALYGEPSSVIDLTTAEPTIVRRGAGDLSWLGVDDASGGSRRD